MDVDGGRMLGRIESRSNCTDPEITHEVQATIPTEAPVAEPNPLALRRR